MESKIKDYPIGDCPYCGHKQRVQGWEFEVYCENCDEAYQSWDEEELTMWD